MSNGTQERKTPFTPADQQNLPGGTTIEGASYPETVPYTMQVDSTNGAGTVIGSIPSDVSHAFPWKEPILGYAVRSPDGQYSPFVPLINTSLMPGDGGHL